ncbi:MAG: thiol-disulfide oxidoreductase DCC family protein [Agromyces sp.]
MSTMIYDGDCGLCNASREWAERTLSQPPEFVTSQSITAGEYGVSADELSKRVWLITSNGVFGGHDAIAMMFIAQPQRGWRFAGHLMLTPPICWIGRLTYLIVARNRHRIRVGDQQCASGVTPTP